MPAEAWITAVPSGNDSARTSNNRDQRLNIIGVQRTVEPDMNLPHGNEGKQVAIPPCAIQLRDFCQLLVFGLLGLTKPLNACGACGCSRQCAE